MSENTSENDNEDLDQEEQQDQTQGEEQGQESETMELDEERMFGPEDENVPKEIKEKVEGLGMGKPNAYYQVSEEEYEKMKKHIPEDLQKTIASSKIKNGAAPQLWLPFFNTVALFASLIPGLGAIVGLTTLYGNLKILPMWPKKKVENSIGHNITGNKPERVENSPSTFGSKDNNKKQSFGSKDNNNNSGKQSFGSKKENNGKQYFGSKDNDTGQTFGSKKTKSLPSFFGSKDNNKKQNFGSKEEDNKKQSFGSKDNNNNNEKQPFGSKDENNQKQPFGTAGTNPSPEPETAKSNTVKFGTADNNSVLDSLKKINQSSGTGRSSSSPAMRAEELKRLKKQFKKPNVPTP